LKLASVDVDDDHRQLDHITEEDERQEIRIIEESQNGKKETKFDSEDILEDPSNAKTLSTDFEIPQFQPDHSNPEEEVYKRGLEAELKGEEYKEEEVVMEKKKSIADQLKSKRKLATIVLNSKKKKVYDRMLVKEAAKESKKEVLVSKRESNKKVKA